MFTWARTARLSTPTCRSVQRPTYGSAFLHQREYVGRLVPKVDYAITSVQWLPVQSKTTFTFPNNIIWAVPIPNHLKPNPFMYSLRYWTRPSETHTGIHKKQILAHWQGKVYLKWAAFTLTRLECKRDLTLITKGFSLVLKG